MKPEDIRTERAITDAEERNRDEEEKKYRWKEISDRSHDSSRRYPRTRGLYDRRIYGEYGQMKNQTFLRRLGYAASGIRKAFQEERSFRIQVGAAFGVTGLLIAMRPAPIWWGLVALTSGAVLAAELFNTALEAVVDRLHPARDPLIGKAKDCAAGAVLLLGFAAIAVAVAMVFATEKLN